MGVPRFRQTIMTEWLDGIAGAHERFEKTNLQRLTDGQRIQLLQQSLNFATLTEVAAGHAVAENFLAILLQAPFVRLFVHAVDRILILAYVPARLRFVCMT